MPPDSSQPEIKLTCPAKVNLALSVAAPAEDGFHEIASWMVAVQFGDRLSLERLAERADSSFDIAFDDDSPRPSEIDWPLETDLAFRAHHALQEYTGQPLPIRCRIDKKIPTGAGVGGGSANAAAMMLGLTQLFDIEITTDALIDLSQPLGSDIAFALGAMTGSPSALVTGRGEQLQPLTLSNSIPLVLIFPPFGCPTGAVYAAFDRLLDGDRSKSANVDRVRELAANQPPPQDAPFNDLGPAACAAVPELGKLKATVESALELPVHITGSGSTLFVIAPSDLTAKVLARKVETLCQLPAIASRTR